MAVVFDERLLTEHAFTAVFWTALATLIPILAFAVWGSGLFKLLCALIGILSGYVAAAWLGAFTPADPATTAGVPIVAIPGFHGISFAVSIEVVVMFLIAALANGLRTVGVLTTCEQINDADWRRPSWVSVSWSSRSSSRHSRSSHGSSRIRRCPSPSSPRSA